jgi:RcsF protein
MLSRSPVEPVQSTVIPPAKSEPAKTKAMRPAPVRIYTDATELVGKPFRELGEVTGESCQASNQDSPPNIPTARKRMQVNAAKMKANAVLLHRCEVTSGTPGCYRQAVCLGSALNVTAQ